MILDRLIHSFDGHGTGITHLAVVVGERVITEWYRRPITRNIPHMLHSATKSFVGTAVGMAISENLLSLDSALSDLLPKAHSLANRSEQLSRLTIRDMLTMRTGHERGTSGVVWRGLDTSWVDAYLDEPITGTAGIDFIYSSGTSHILSVCLQNAAGVTTEEFLTDRLFRPLGFGDLSWERDPEGYSSGGNGLSIRTIDFAKWGQLHLNGGLWNGRRILDREWVEASTKSHVEAGHSTWTGSGYARAASSPDPSTYGLPDTDSAERMGSPASGSSDGEGYGYQIWVRDGAFYASGMFGQYCVVVPQADCVVAVNSSLNQAQSRLLSQRIVECVQEADSAALVPKTRTVDRPIVENVDCGAVFSPQAGNRPENDFGWLEGTHRTDDGTSVLTVTLDRTGPYPLLTVAGVDPAGELAFSAGVDVDHSFTGRLYGPSLHHSYNDETPIIARAESTGPWSVMCTVAYLSSPFVDRHRFELDSDGSIVYSRSVNVNSQTTELAGIRLVQMVSGSSADRS